jgi:hypothetical protein
MQKTLLKMIHHTVFHRRVFRHPFLFSSHVHQQLRCVHTIFENLVRDNYLVLLCQHDAGLHL